MKLPQYKQNLIHVKRMGDIKIPNTARLSIHREDVVPKQVIY